MHVLSLWVPSLQGAEVVGAEFERCRVCWCRVCKVQKCPVFKKNIIIALPIRLFAKQIFIITSVRA